MEKATIQEIRSLLSSNDIRTAISKLTAAAQDDQDLLDQVSVIAAQYAALFKSETLGFITFEQKTIQRAQIINALLAIISGQEQKRVDSNGAPPASKKVFISYNHSNTDTALILKEKLLQHNMDVIIDNQNILAGDDIKQFIERSIRESHATISIVSKKSLLSSWVAMESINTFYHERIMDVRKFIPCYVEADFFNRSFTDEALDHVQQELSDIRKIKANRIEKGRNTRDLDNEYTRLAVLSNEMDEIVRRLRESLCIDISNGKLEQNFPKILERILS